MITQESSIFFEGRMKTVRAWEKKCLNRYNNCYSTYKRSCHKRDSNLRPKRLSPLVFETWRLRPLGRSSPLLNLDYKFGGLEITIRHSGFGSRTQCDIKSNNFKFKTFICLVEFLFFVSEIVRPLTAFQICQNFSIFYLKKRKKRRKRKRQLLTFGQLHFGVTVIFEKLFGFCYKNHFVCKKSKVFEKCKNFVSILLGTAGNLMTIHTLNLPHHGYPHIQYSLIIFMQM